MGSESRSEIVFFDLETTIPFRSGQKHAILEFGAILVCPRKLIELDSYSSFVRPANLSFVSPASVKCNGITREDVASAPTFEQIADKIYDILHGRVWAGHNILRFDCVRIREAFSAIGRPAPEPKGTIDSLAVLTEKFGRRAGDMKMATLATYFGLGQQKHRSLDDVRMNLEVVKHCATVLFLESSLPDILINDLTSPMSATRSRTNRNLPPEGMSPNSNYPSLPVLGNPGVSSPSLQTEPNIPVVTSTDPLDIVRPIDQMTSTDPLDMVPLIDRMTIDHPSPTVAEGAVADLSEPSSNIPAVSEGCSGYAGFLEPDEVSMSSISASLVPYSGCQRSVLQHRGVPLLLCCMKMRIVFRVNRKFLDYSGRPKLSIVVEPSPNLCQVLDMCDQLAKRLSMDLGSSSEWKPVVIRKNGFLNSPVIRINIPTVVNGDTVTYSTEMYQKELMSGTQHKIVFSRFDAAELDSLFVPGSFLDGYFCLDLYDYQGNAGIRLVAKRLVVESK